MTPEELRAGQVLHVTSRASVQFVMRPILFRLIRVKDITAPVGWVYLDGYELDASGKAVERREILVQPAGLRLFQPANADTQRQRAARAAQNSRTAPQQRTSTKTTGRNR